MLDAGIDGTPSFGAGVIVGARTGTIYIVTADHNLRSPASGKPAEWVKIRFADAPNDAVTATILDRHDKNLDIGFISVPRPSWIDKLPLDTVSWRVPRRGNNVVRMGQPNKRAWWSSPRQDPVVQIDEQLVQFESATIAHGDSGGALFGRDRALMGIVTEDSAPPTATAVRIDIIQRLCRRWKIPFDVGRPSSAALESPGDDAVITEEGDEDDTVSSWIQIKVRPNRVPIISGIFSNRDFVVHVYHARSELKIPVTTGQLAVSEPLLVDPAEPLSVSLEMVGRLGSNDIATDAGEVYPDAKLRAGTKLRLRYLPSFANEHSEVARMPPLELTLHSQPFEVGRHSGPDGRPAGAQEVGRDSLIQDSVSFNDGDDIDYYRLKASGIACAIAVLADSGQGLVVNATDALGQRAVPLAAETADSGAGPALWVIDCKQIGAGRLLVKAIESGAQSEYRLYVSGDSHQPALEFLRAWVHSVVSEGHAKSNQGSQLVGALTEKLRVRFEVEPCTLIQLLAEVAAAGDTFHDAYGAIEAVLRPSLRTYAVALKECPSPRISAVAAVLSLEKHDPADDAALRRAAAELTEAYVVRLLRALAERPRGESTTEVTKAVAERHDLSKETRDLAERLNAP